MRYLRTNTATRITVGPFLDKTDGITPEVALTVTSEKLTFVVDDGGVPTLVLDTAPTASGGANDMVHITNDDAGFYDLELAAANVNYVGRAMLALTDAATHCPVFHEFMILPANVWDSLVLGSGTDLLDVSAVQLAGTACTGRDIGASVLLSPGTGTGQLDFTSGVVKANLVQILAAVITGTAAQLVAAFAKFFNVATPTGTINSLPDAVPDASGGLPVTGTRLTAIPWNAAWDAEVQSECADALLADSPARPTGAVATDAGNSATSFKTTLTSAVDDFWKDALLLITSGALLGQHKKVTGYNGTTKIVAVEAFTATPADDVTFMLINR
jgi:hypothetical protein